MKLGALVVLAALLLAGTSCRRAVPGEDAPSRRSAVLALVEAGRFDEAIARVGSAEDPESLYLLGRAWAGKAQQAPLPTPVPGSSAPVESLFKPEELTALGFLERAVAARPDHAAAQLALAELLAPHALATLGSRGHAGPAAAASSGPDVGVERVLRCYGDAIQADPAGAMALESLIGFATAAGRLAETDAAFQELIRRKREDPGLLVRYGDFLAGPKGAPEAALAQYAQALIWRPDDTNTRLKMADLHLRAAAEHLARQEYLGADARLKEVRRLGIDPASPQGARMRELEQALSEIRRR